jgi:ribonuclease BN (tRNA processing enzyme)
VRKLLLGHFSARYENNTAFETEAKIIFENVTATKEGMRIIASPDEIITEF